MSNKPELIPITNKYADERGIIENITPPVQIRDILYITGEKGAIRGNHYHKKDTHYCYIISGEIKYSWKDHGSEKVYDMVLKPGDMVVSRPLQLHRFEFLAKGAFIAMATESREQENYEEDTIREVI